MRLRPSRPSSSRRARAAPALATILGAVLALAYAGAHAELSPKAPESPGDPTEHTDGWDGPGQGSVTLGWYLGWVPDDPACAVVTDGVTDDASPTTGAPLAFDDVETAVEAAMATWEAAADVRFVKVGDARGPGRGCFEDPEADPFDCDGNEDTFQINVYWALGAHCQDPGRPVLHLDGPWDPSNPDPDTNGHVFGHAWGPYDTLPLWPPNVYGGNVHLDDDENWVTSGASDFGDGVGVTQSFAFVDIETEVLHELGHSLGLAHTGTGGSVMNPVKWDLERRALTQFDVDEIRRLYRAPRQHPGVALVFDLSGSMNRGFDGQVDPPAGRSRLDLAKRAAQPFLALLAEHGEDVAEFAIGRFQGAGGCDGATVKGMTLIDDVSLAQASDVTIPGLAAGGSTPLLAGIEHAATLYSDQDRRAVVLLSDGYHNCPGTVNAGDAEVTDAIDAMGGALVYPVGFGRPEDVDSPLLSRLAAETGGLYHAVTGPDLDPGTWDPATALQETFKNVLVDALGLETAADPLAVVEHGGSNVHAIPVTGADDRVSILVSWAKPDPQRLVVGVLAADGTRVSADRPGVSVTTGDAFHLVSVDRALLDRPGVVGAEPWRLVVGPHLMKPGEREPYQYTAVLDSALELRPMMERAPASTGDALVVRAALVEHGRGLGGLDRVWVTVERPDEGRGEWFARHEVTRAQLEEAAALRAERDVPPLALKASALARVAGVEMPGRTRGARLRLHDDGTRGDARAGDGVYTRELAPADVPGVYDFRIVATGTASDGTVFRREARAQRVVAARMDPARTEVALGDAFADEAGTRTVAVTVTPRDALGNLVGPGYAGRLSLRADAGEATGGWTDLLDGRYRRSVTIPAGERATGITVSMGGARKSLVAAIPAPATGIGWLLPWVLLVLAVIAIGVIASRRH